jgi:hypothetical protein
LKLRDSFRQLRARAAAFPPGFQEARAQEFRNELQLVGGKARQKTVGPVLERMIGARSQRGNQGVSH